MAERSAYPEGIGANNIFGPGSGLRTWLPLGVLGAVLLVAISGVLGGQPNPVIARSTAAAELTLKAPKVLRNGEFFELRIGVDAHQRVEAPVMAISASYWRDLTINSMIPAPTGESFKDGYYTFEFEPLAAGDTFEVKIDGQVNPPLVGVNRGALELRDDERTLVRLNPALRVLP